VAIPVLHKEIVSIHRWLTEEEFARLIGLIAGIPGPIVQNTAVYVGYKLGGLPGAFAAFLGVVVPPLAIMSLVTILLIPYWDHEIVRVFLRGASAAVLGLIFVAFLLIARATLVSPSGFQVPVFLFAMLVIILIAVLNIHPLKALLISIAASFLTYYLLGF